MNININVEDLIALGTKITKLTDIYLYKNHNLLNYKNVNN